MADLSEAALVAAGEGTEEAAAPAALAAKAVWNPFTARDKCTREHTREALKRIKSDIKQLIKSPLPGVMVWLDEKDITMVLFRARSRTMQYSRILQSPHSAITAHARSLSRTAICVCCAKGTNARLHSMGDFSRARARAHAHTGPRAGKRAL